MSKDAQRITVITSRKKKFDLNLRETFHYRDLIGLFVANNFKARYKQMLLGPLWAVIQPLLTTVVFTVVFGRIAGLPTDGVPKFMFYMCGNVLWTYFSGCLNGSACVFSENAYLFSKVYFPRLVSPVSNALGNMLNSGIQFIIFLCFLVYFIIKGSITPDYKMIWLAVLLILQVSLLAMGIGTLLASVTVKYRDLKMLISFGLQLWLYASPVAYSAELVKSKAPQLLNAYMLNPMAPVCEAMRRVFIGKGMLSIKYLLISAAFTVVIAILGTLVFNRTEKTFMDKI